MHRYYAYFFPSFPVEKLAVSGWPHLPHRVNASGWPKPSARAGRYKPLWLGYKSGRRWPKGWGASLRRKALQAPTIDRRGLERRIRAKLQDWRGLLERNVAEGRAALRALLIGPIRFTPVREERRRGYRFELTIALDGLLAGVIELPTKMASPRGIDGRWHVPTKVASPAGFTPSSVSRAA